MACLGGCLFFLDLEFKDIGRVLNNLGDIGSVTRADLTEDTLEDPNNAAD